MKFLHKKALPKSSRKFVRGGLQKFDGHQLCLNRKLKSTIYLFIKYASIFPLPSLSLSIFNSNEIEHLQNEGKCLAMHCHHATSMHKVLLVFLISWFGFVPSTSVQNMVK
jgi:hypothetical protein